MMDAKTLAELTKSVDLIRGHLKELTVQIDVLSMRLAAEKVPPDEPPPPGSGPVTPGLSGETESLQPMGAEIRVDSKDWEVEIYKAMARLGHRDVTTYSLDPEIDLKLFHPAGPGEPLRPIVYVKDLEHISRLPAQLRLLGDLQLNDGISIAAPATSDAIETRVKDVLDSYGAKVPGSIKYLGLGE